MSSTYLRRSPSSQPPSVADPDHPPRPSSPEHSGAWPERPASAKNIVLCLDGTGNHFSDKNTNIVKIFECLVKNQPDDQVVYYQTGVGTTSEKSLITPITSYVSGWLDSSIGWYLDSHVMEAYKFVQAHYAEGDRICVFGYSRGAYTARALCGFLHAIGVLPRSNIQQVDYAYQVWKSGDQLACQYYKSIMSLDVDIEFLGCFDTVSSVGALIPRVLPFSTHNGKTRVFRHALSLDEYRAKFRQETWHYSLPTKPFSLQDRLKETVTLPLRYIKEWMASDEERGTEEYRKALTELVLEYQRQTRRPVDIKEVWFAGGHADVGGGATSDYNNFSLSNISLRWMMKEAIKSDSRILFDNDKLQRFGFQIPQDIELPDAEDAQFYIGSNGERDRIADSRLWDVTAPSHIASESTWWPLEFLPVLERKQANSGKWVLDVRVNFFRSRTIPRSEAPNDPDGQKHWEADRKANIPIPGPLFHESVRERKQVKDNSNVYSRSWDTWFFKGPYQPYAKPPGGVDPIYVE